MLNCFYRRSFLVKAGCELFQELHLLARRLWEDLGRLVVKRDLQDEVDDVRVGQDVHDRLQDCA